jgi:hypothetical protein
MSPDSLFCQFDAAGVEVFIHGDRLRFRVPTGVFTPTLRSLVEQAPIRAQLRKYLGYRPALGQPTRSIQKRY